MPEFWADWRHQNGIFRLKLQVLLLGDSVGILREASVFAGYTADRWMIEITLHMAASTDASSSPKSNIPLVMYAMDSTVYVIMAMRANFS